VADHLHGADPTPEPWTALTWVAAVTERIGVMPNVLGLPYRAPAVTAEMAETLDRFSGGRLVLGLGTGGYDAEFSAFGLSERTAGQKVAALGEALKIIRGLWREPSLSYAGEHFHVRDARIEPKPAHPIPIWLGAYGPRSLRMTGALADGWVPSPRPVGPGAGGGHAGHRPRRGRRSPVTAAGWGGNRGGGASLIAVALFPLFRSRETVLRPVEGRRP
jgi:alkanesulfonate monooxygenase SsuD/methylene tetrahydromethanopterin reductase-like flavin-dependent oxidoreductase (luciferase family)